MPDSKITALTAITTVNPATFPLVIVDTSDTSMATTGTTKKVTTNQLLGAGGTATLASATITGDLTVDTSTLKVDSTNNRVGVGTASPAYLLDIADASFATRFVATNTNNSAFGAGVYLKTLNGASMVSNATLATSNDGTFNLLTGTSADSTKLSIGPTGIFTFQNVGGVAGTAMTLNATGLGVGVSPATKLDVRGATNASQATFSGTAGRGLLISTRSDSLADDRTVILNAQFATGSLGQLVIQTAGTDRLLVDSSGNVGIGVTPSAWAAGFKAIQIGATSGQAAALFNNGLDNTWLVSNAFFSGGNWNKFASGTATLYEQGSGAHKWYNNTTVASGTFTPTQAMTLDASGNLLVGVASGGTARLDIRTSASQRIINAFSTAAGDSSTYGVYIAKFANDSTTAQRFIGFTINNDGAGSGQINANGASQAAFGTFSDSRLKENIVSLPSQLANILSLRPVEFDYKDGSGHQIGFVAQEVQEVYSDAVSEQDGFLTVTGWSKTEARLVSAIKELADKVQALEAKLA